MRFLALLITLAALSPLFFGAVSGCGGSVDSTSVIDPSVSLTPLDLPGDYTFRDRNCTFRLPTEIRVLHHEGEEDQEPFLTLTIVEHGGSNLRRGDAFFGQAENGLANFWPTLGCVAERVISDEDTFEIRKTFLIAVARGDLLMTCRDYYSRDTLCSASYKPTQ